MKITFLVGAGCEGYGQLDLPSGNRYKEETILAKEAKEFIKKINKNIKQYKITNGTIIRNNSTSILYQTLIEHEGLFDLNDEDKDTFQKYKDIKRDEENYNDDEKRDIKNRFEKMYKKYFDLIENKTENQRDIDNYNIFLKNACFYSFVDSLFNHLREPEKYQSENGRVMKLYYSAYCSIIKSFIDKKEFGEFINSTSQNSIINNRKKLLEILNKAQKKTIKNNLNNDGLYYNIIKELKKDRLDINIVTTNYTSFVRDLTGIKEDNIAYVHGKLELFEDIKTKRIARLDEFNEDDFVFPFIFIQSGIKPIVSCNQIMEYGKAVRMILDADVVIVLGYGINSDDEHIMNILRERLRSENNDTIFFQHEMKTKDKKQEKVKEDEREKINKKLFTKKIKFYDTYDFKKVINGLVEMY